jgi:hypothetical protein
VTDPTHRDLPYETADPLAYRWTDAAYDMCAGDDPTLHAEVVTAHGVSRVLVHGRCPRCAGEISSDSLLTASGESGVLGDDDAEPEPDPYTPVHVVCGCPLAHPGRPDGATGCGIGFTIEVWRGDVA